jgi:hypothetical protein
MPKRGVLGGGQPLQGMVMHHFWVDGKQQGAKQ